MFASPLSPLTANQWQTLAAQATVGTFVVAFATVVFAIRQFYHARRIRIEQTNPYVITYFDLINETSPEIIFVIKNIGPTPAFDITLMIDPPMVRANEYDGHSFMETKVISKGIAMLVPNQEIRLLFEKEAARVNQNLPTDFKATVSFVTSDKRRLTKKFDLDVEWGRGRVYPPKIS